MRKRKLMLISGIVLIICICISAGVFWSKYDKKSEPSLDEVVKEKLTAYETDIRDSLVSMNQNADVAQYLKNWAANKKIMCSSDSNGNVIFTIQAAEGYEAVPPVAVICEFDAENMANYIEPMATALTIAKNPQHNGTYYVIFLAQGNILNNGANTISSSYFTDNTRVFYLGQTEKAKVSAVTGGYCQYTITDPLNYTDSSYDKAYKITIKNVSAETINAKMNNTPNAIKTLGSLLANFKSTSLLFELSKFSGGTDADKIPDKASVTVVINSSDEKKFIQKMDKIIDKFNDKYLESCPEIEYTYKEVKVPSKVLIQSETENIVSLLYTSPDGIYYKDDDGNVTAMTNIGLISTKDNILSVKISSMSCDKSLTGEISEAYETICGLCNVKYDLTKEFDMYSGSALSDSLLKEFESAFTDYTDKSEMVIEDTVQLTGCTFIHQKNENMPILYCSITEKSKEKFAGSIITFLNNETKA